VCNRETVLEEEVKLEDQGRDVEFEVPTAVATNNVFFDITPCSPVKVNQRFGETYCLHFQGRRVSQASSKQGLQRRAVR
jgi:hypothetical protein